MTEDNIITVDRKLPWRGPRRMGYVGLVERSIGVSQK